MQYSGFLFLHKPETVTDWNRMAANLSFSITSSFLLSLENRLPFLRESRHPFNHILACKQFSQ